MRVPIPATGPTYRSRSKSANSQQTINLYPKRENPGAKGIIGLYHTPCRDYEVSAGVGPTRSDFITWKNKSYHINGSELIQIDKNNTKTVIGALNTTGGWVVLSRGRDHIAMVDGTNGYTYDGTTFAQIADPDFPNGATYIEYRGGRWIVNSADSDQWSESDAEDPTSWDPLRFATAEAEPDDAHAIATSPVLVYLIGSETTQMYTDSVDTDFSFDQYPGGIRYIGIAADYSLANCKDDGIVFLAQDGDGDTFVALLNGIQYRRISDSDLEQLIAGYTTRSDAIGGTYRQEGRRFYVLTFPSADATFVYDFTEGLWHERKSWNMGQWRARGFGYFNNKPWVGDSTNGKTYSLKIDLYEDDGDRMERIRVCQYIHKDHLPIVVNELVLDIEAGTTPEREGQGSDPVVMMRYSVDRGQTWSNELQASMGKQGKYDWECVWTQLGDCGYEVLFEFKVTDPVSVTINGAYAMIELGAY